MNISQQVIILTAESKNNTFEGNRQRTENLKGCLQDINISFNTATGVFNNGAEETSIVAIVKNEADIQAVSDFAFKNFDQDAVLHQDANQEARLLNKDGTILALGRLQQVTKEVAIAKGSYTLMNGVYYTTIPRI
jgi:hypothetical protein